MNKNSFLKRILKTVHKLSPGFLILGICLIAWASYQIYTQSAPAPVSVEQPAEESGLTADTSVSAEGEKREETQTEDTATNEENQTDTQIPPDTTAPPEAKKEKETQTAASPTEDTAKNEENQTDAQIPPDTTAPPNVQKEKEAVKVAQAQTETKTETPKQNSISDETLYPVRPKVGENIGNLTMPAIDQTLPIIHGTDEDELSKGIGHFAGSVLPGENDNSVLSGHRDTVFKELDQLEINDELIVETSAGTFTYEIREIKIVPRDDKTIITPSASPVLTVTTCYPFNFIGSAPDRYILIADLVSSE
ncbi:class D sortase [Sinobaca sp. H24]|uniref:class D sortase n=1 Tax=Sinobaca sp. H24 TaxID=2923376 RepID=UPI0027E23AFA|nr:class D sortase [Sinobaca sp. H24]